MPAVIDSNGPGGQSISIFESGAILLHYAEQAGKFIPSDSKGRVEVLQWLFFQMAYVGPMLGQAHQYLFYHKGKSEFAEQRSRTYSNNVYEILDTKLSKNKYICNEYSIADIAVWPWVARFERHQINLKNYSNVLRWYITLSKRPAIIKGYNIIGDFNEIPIP